MQACQASWYTRDWPYRYKVTVNASQVNGDLAEFPIYLDLSHFDSSFFDNLAVNGSDLRITAGDGANELPLELVELDTANGTGELWFRADSLSATNNSDFYLYFGNPSASLPLRSDAYGSENVWSNGFVAVYHMNQDPSLGAGAIIDSSQYLNHGTANATMLSNDLVNGQLGSALDFDGVDDEILVPDSVSLSPTREISMSFWYKTAVPDTSIGVITKGPVSGSYDYMAYFTGAGFSVSTYVRDSASSTYNVFNGFNYSDNLWHLSYHQFSNADTLLSVFSDDTGFDSNGIAAVDIRDSADPLRIASGWNDWFNSLMDEVRVSDKVRSHAWVRTEYANQKNASSFYAVVGPDCYTPSFDSFPYLSRITIPASQVNGDLTEFPVFYDLATMPDEFFAYIGINGETLRMSNAAKTQQQPIELVNLDIVNGSGELWFRADLSSSVDNDFYLYWGHSEVKKALRSCPYGSENVWSNGFVAVYHMNEDPSLGNGAVIDSTSYLNHGTANGSMTTSDSINGQLGSAINFDGTDDYIDLGNDAELNLTTTFTLSAWTRSTSWAANVHPMIIAKGVNQSYIMWQEDDAGANVAFGARVNNPAFYHVYSDPSIVDNEWYFVSSTLNGTALSVYQDGNIGESLAFTGSISAVAEPVTLGAGRVPPVNRLNGDIDEARIANKARSAEWIKTEFNNQNGVSSFVTFAQKDKNLGLWKNASRIRIHAAEVNGDHANFPVYVDLSDMPANFFSQVKSDGADIRIYDSTQSQEMALELVELDTANGTGELWFKADALSGTLDNDFYIFYNNTYAQAALANSEFGSQAVWSNGYAAVYHMSQDPTLGAGSILDSTQYQNHGSPVNGTNPFVSTDLQNGQLGSGIYFEGNGNYILIPNSSSLENIQENDYSLSSWFYPSYTPTGVGSANKGLYGIIMKNGFHSGLRYNPSSFNLDHWLTGNVGAATSSSASYPINTFYKVDGVMQRSIGQTGLYVDAVDFQTSSWLAGTATREYAVESWRIGMARPTSTYRWYAHGIIDEVRLSNKERSSSWIDTEYHNQSSPASFYSIEEVRNSNAIFHGRMF